MKKSMADMWLKSQNKHSYYHSDINAEIVESKTDTQSPGIHGHLEACAASTKNQYPKRDLFKKVHLWVWGFSSAA